MTTSTTEHLTEPTRLHEPKRRRGAARMAASIATGLVGVVAIAAAAGAAYEAIAELATEHPPAGRMVDIGGYALHLDCRGAGSPTVLLDAGLGGASLDWSLVQPALAATTQVCSYDRAGMGWSDVGPGSRTPARLASELHALVKNGGVTGPYILVGHSLAGKTQRLFAAAYPDEVAGMVLVDARGEMIESASDRANFEAALADQATQYTVARRLGIARLFGAAIMGLPLVPHELVSEMAILATNPAAIAETTQEGLSRSADDSALAGVTLGSLPLTVLAAGQNMTRPEWAAAQAEMARLSSRGELIVAEGSGHSIHLEQPAYVIETIARMVASIRSSR